MLVKDVMTPLAESVQPDDTLRDATEKMHATGLEPMPVTENGELVGVLTDSVVKQTAATDGLATGSKRVEEVMTTNIACCCQDEDVITAVKHLGEHPERRIFRRLPVVDRDQRLVGFVSVEALRKNLADDELAGSGVAGVLDVESISSLVNFDDDRVSYMSNESFPASDPPPPPGDVGG